MYAVTLNDDGSIRAVFDTEVFVDEGAVLHEITPEQFATLAGATSLGDWRLHEGALEAHAGAATLLRQRQAIDRARDAAIEAGVTFDGHLYDSDQRSRDNLTGAVAAFSAGVPVPEGFTWRTADNQNVPMTLESLRGLAAAMLAHVDAQYRAAWAAKDALEGE